MTACPELIVRGEELLALGQTWFVAIVPSEYTSHVLLPRPKIFSLLSEILNLQLFLMSITLARKREPMQSCTIFVSKPSDPHRKMLNPDVCNWRGQKTKSLKCFGVTDGNEVCLADFRNDGDVGGEVKMDRQTDKFVKRKKIFHFDKWNMQNNDDSLLFQSVDERNFKFVEVSRLVDEIVKIVFVVQPHLCVQQLVLKCLC